MSIAIPFIAAAIGSAATATKDNSWYDALSKPVYNPPGWVFGLVWNPLYTLMGISLFLVWKSEVKLSKMLAYTSFGVQLALNALWSVIFFGLEIAWGGVVVNLFLLLAIFWTIKEFWRISRRAVYLMLPYLAWVVFATFLNAHIALLN